MALFGITIFGISKIEVKTYNSKMFSSIMALSKVLYQNNPNPWSETTEIRYTLPDDARDAAVYIFDFSGKLLKTLNATGSSSVCLKAPT